MLFEFTKKPEEVKYAKTSNEPVSIIIKWYQQPEQTRMCS